MYIIMLLTARKNFAFDGVATQSSTHGFYTPKMAIDGNIDNNVHSSTCSQTLEEFYPWWKVTFKYDILVSEVVIVNRGDCCGKSMYVILPN